MSISLTEFYLTYLLMGIIFFLRILGKVCRNEITGEIHYGRWTYKNLAREFNPTIRTSPLILLYIHLWILFVFVDFKGHIRRM